MVRQLPRLLPVRSPFPHQPREVARQALRADRLRTVGDPGAHGRDLGVQGTARSAVRPCRAPIPNIVLQGKLPDLGVQAFHVQRCLRGPSVGEHIGRPFHQLLLPRRDLAGVELEPLGQTGERAFIPHLRQGSLRFEVGSIVPRGSLGYFGLLR